MPLSSTSLPFPDLIEESLEEATFLWQRWEGELRSLTRNLDQVWAWTEDRLQGAIDGARVGIDGGVGLGIEALLSDDPHRITLGAALVSLSSAPDAIAALVKALDPDDTARFDRMVRALELVGSRESLRAVALKLRDARPSMAAALARLKRFRRSAPGAEMKTAFESAAAADQVVALNAATWASESDATALVLRGLMHEQARVRFAAAETGLRFGVDEAWAYARRVSSALDDQTAPFLTLLATLGTAEDHEIIFDALRVPALQLPAIWALGHVGTSRAVEACLAGMQREGLERAAGEAYCWITGADLERDRLSLVEPAPDAPALEDDDLDADLVPRPDDLWPKPDVDRVRQHWEQRSTTLPPQTRSVLGTTVNAAALLAAIETGPMIRRADLAFEVLVRTRGRYDVETQAFTERQRSMMAAGRTALGHAGIG